MNEFSEVLQELMKERNVTVTDLKKYLSYSNESTIYKWLRKEVSPKVDKAVMIAEYFGCSLQYLAGMCDNYDEKKTYLPCPPFAQALRNILKEKKISQYALIKNTCFNYGNIYSWFNLNSVPQLDTVIKLANFFDVTLEHLVGRE